MRAAFSSAVIGDRRGVPFAFLLSCGVQFVGSFSLGDGVGSPLLDESLASSRPIRVANARILTGLHVNLTDLRRLVDLHQ